MRPRFFGQKWLLGFALAIVYIPLRTFINVRVDFWTTILHKLPLFSVEILISTVFYTSWIYLMDWFLKKLPVLTGSERSADFKLSHQLIALIPAVLLALVFNIMLINTWGFMDSNWIFSPKYDHYRTMSMDAKITRYHANQALTILALIAGYYLCVSSQAQEKLQKLLVDSEKLATENMSARFLALKNQISPHFLFNNLSVLASLVESRPEKSSEFIQQLSLAYRYILEQAELRQISLKEELNFLETYTYLLQMRFHEKIILDVHVSQADQDRYAIIPLTLQPLIENAVKHNTMSVANPLRISITIEHSVLIVRNPLQVRNLREQTTGLGLNNLASRYKLLQDKAVVIEQTETDFTVKIPLLS
ncbi:sensor histidine kinase [Dyadobacter sp. CY347]|uniref:sensor histidine kinase n=1 Tax=Dyadobacter sp. CY347 TaxID=2909336 RepID=UPI001F2E6A29|nr:histidine kinase [Dyadobacter sp. CY347]MCF2489165.1 histidine kinase [Dyadobacter sp. CY347]